MELKNLNVEYLEGCSEESKKLADLYWELDNHNQFVNKPSQIEKVYNLWPQTLFQIIDQCSFLQFEMKCDECNHTRIIKNTSQNQFHELVRDYRKAYNSFQCSSCKQIEKERKALKLKEERDALEKRLDKAIDQKKYEDLSPYYKKLLHDCITNLYIDDLIDQYWKSSGKLGCKQLSEGLFYLDSLDLIAVDRSENSHKIRDYQCSNRLKEEFKYEQPIKDNDLVVLQTNETNNLRLELTLNPDSNHPGCTELGGTLMVKEQIVIEPNIEYAYAQMPRADGCLCLTLVPKEAMCPSLRETSYSVLPISYYDEDIEEYFQDIPPPF